MTAPAFRLRWVMADPGQERAVDALGTSAQADRLAQELLPGLSVATNRARYLSFLCWAVRESEGKLQDIHRLEATLALDEAELVRDEVHPAGDCLHVVGRQKALAHLNSHDGQRPKHPERLYKNTAFAAYRTLMRSLGFLVRSKRPKLTEPGKALAAAFFQKRGPSPRCLSDLSPGERGPIRSALGLDLRTSPTAAQKRRRDTAEVLRDPFRRGETTLQVLDRFGRAGANRRDRVKHLLHLAYVWELLSVGLAHGFALLLEEGSLGRTERALRIALRGRPRHPNLSDEATAEAAPAAVAHLRAALSFDPADLFPDTRHIAAAKLLVDDRNPRAFVERLVELHTAAKQDSRWLALRGDKLEELVPAKVLSFAPQVRGYRLDAFRQLLTDLRYGT